MNNFVPSPYTDPLRNEPEICKECLKAIHFVGIDYDQNCEIYRCPCGELYKYVPCIT